MKNLVVIIGTCVVLFVACVLVLMPLELGEIQSEVSIIKMLPADYNPYQRLYEELLKPTVRISSASGIGSGVVIPSYKLQDTSYKLDNLKPVTFNSVTYVLTAAHVVENQSIVTVTFYSYNQPDKSGNYSSCLIYEADVVMTDTNKDLALLAADTHGLTRTYSAKLARKDYQPFLFAPVYAVGCSLGLPPRPSQGIITSISENQCSSVAIFWEISAPILPGNSGGPVFDANTHEVIGIAVWVKTYYGQLITTMAGIVPISEIYEFLNRVQEFNSSQVQK